MVKVVDETKRKQGRPKADQTGKTVGFYAEPKTIDLLDQFFAEFPKLTKSQVFNELIENGLPRLRRKHTPKAENTPQASY